MSRERGLKAEEFARDYLIEQGLKWIESNFRCRCGEIDLIMLDKNDLVFVEVRLRKTAAYGNALESIHYHKQQKLIKTASMYLLMKYKKSTPACRFDALTLDGLPPRVQWIKNAFTLNGGYEHESIRRQSSTVIGNTHCGKNRIGGSFVLRYCTSGPTFG